MAMFLSASVGATNINDDGYLNPEPTATVEGWMFDTNYLAGVSESIESWMLDECWLDQAKEEFPVESWMMDSNYLVKESQDIESWMLDAGYLKR